jgi:hypothetical protein
LVNFIFNFLWESGGIWQNIWTSFSIGSGIYRYNCTFVNVRLNLQKQLKAKLHWIAEENHGCKSYDAVGIQVNNNNILRDL